MCFPFTVNYGFFSFFSFLFFLFHVVLFRRSEVYSINVMAATGGYGTHFKRTSSTFLMCGKWLAHLVLFYGGITPHVGGSCSKEFIFVKKKKKKRQRRAGCARNCGFTHKEKQKYPQNLIYK